MSKLSINKSWKRELVGLFGIMIAGFGLIVGFVPEPVRIALGVSWIPSFVGWFAVLFGLYLIVVRWHG